MTRSPDKCTVCGRPATRAGQRCGYHDYYADTCRYIVPENSQQVTHRCRGRAIQEGLCGAHLKMLGIERKPSRAKKQKNNLPAAPVTCLYCDRDANPYDRLCIQHSPGVIEYKKKRLSQRDAAFAELL